MLVEGKVIREIKTVENLNDIHQAQLLSQMKLTGKRLGFLINFNVAVIKYGIKSIFSIIGGKMGVRERASPACEPPYPTFLRSYE